MVGSRCTRGQWKASMAWSLATKSSCSPGFTWDAATFSKFIHAGTAAIPSRGYLRRGLRTGRTRWACTRWSSERSKAAGFAWDRSKPSTERQSSTSSQSSRRLINRQTAATELAPHPLRQLSRRRLGVVQRVLEAELVPFVPPHLMEAQNLHALDRLQAGNDVRQLFDVVVAI